MINLIIASEKKLVFNQDTHIYDELVYKYKYVLEYYISTIIDLNKYEKEIENSNLSIGKNIKYKKINNYLNIYYIFLINNLFVEKLSEEDIELLQTTFNKDNVSSELLNLIKKTYKDIIYDNYLEGNYNNSIYKVCYGPFIPSNMVDNDALVLKIYYGKNLINYDGEAFIKLSKKQLSFFKGLINKIKDEIQEKLDIKCEVLIEKDIY